MICAHARQGIEIGIVTLVWALVVGFTGVINTWADLILQAWQRDQVAVLLSGGAQTLLAADSRVAAPADGSLQATVDRVLAAALVSDGVGDVASWIGLGVPVAVSAWFGLRR